MTVKHGQRARIARELGITAQAVSKLAKIGMPLDSADAARRWRASNLNRLKMKPDPGPSPETLVQRAHELIEVAAVALTTHRFDVVADELRAALRAVPESHRPRVAMPHPVWYALIGTHARRVLDEGPKQEPGTMSDEDAEYVGGLCYSLACGEAHIT
jgi:hypothetical protein